MATEKQIEANRRNAQKSTGPKSESGKAKARFNALKHGMTADVAVLPYEDPNSYEQLREALIGQYQPANAGEQMLVELVVVNYWRLLRARRVEAASFRLHIETIKRRNGKSTLPALDDDAGIAAAFAGPDDTFRNLERYQSGVERSYFRAVETLRKAQNDRRREERRNAPPEKIGFVSKPKAISANHQALWNADRDEVKTPSPSIPVSSMGNTALHCYNQENSQAPSLAFPVL